MINTIIFDCIGIQSYDGGMSPYSEKFLNIVSSKYKLVMLSKTNFNEFSKNAEMRILQKNGTGNYFEVVPLAKNKSTEQYLQCSNKLGIKPEETLIIGNNFDEIKIANESGFQTYFFQNGKSSDESQNGENGQSIKKIKSVDELLRIL